MRTETYNALRQNSVDTVAQRNARLAVWASDPVGIGTTLTAEYAHFGDETVEFLKHYLEDIRIHTDIIAKLDELQG